VTNKKGKFEIADGGTLLLDEVGEIPLNMQVKLLRALQDKKIDVVGDPRPFAVDVRILAATNRDLRQLMHENAFREDLYYRLAVAPLFVPPLRERREDIPLLVHHFLEKLRGRFGKEVKFALSALEALQAYRWPGNVRELENIVERLVVFDRRGTVSAEDLPAELSRPDRVFGKVSIHLPEEDFSLEEVEKDILLAALERHNWNQTHAARYLGMTRNTLIYRMQKYNIKGDDRGGEQSA
jgi:transcriptional regulator with GAF, ATPase, and Fis domain